MFRNKELKQQLEQANQLHAQIQEYQRVLDDIEMSAAEAQTEVKRLNLSAAKLDRGLTKVVDFAKNTKEKQVESEERLTDIEKQIEDVKSVFNNMQNAYEKKQEYIERQQCDLLELQDQSKRYTGLSKKISDISSKDRNDVTDLIESVKGLQQFVFSIGTLALQSAIEAGRMGDDGAEYIKTAEEIRCLAGEFAFQTEQIQRDLESLQSSHQEMDKQMHTFISLLKENTVSLGKISGEATQEKEISLPNDERILSALSEIETQLADLHVEAQDSKQKQNLIMDEMENIGACYMAQQDSTASMAALIGNIKRIISNIESKKGLM